MKTKRNKQILFSSSRSITRFNTFSLPNAHNKKIHKQTRKLYRKTQNNKENQNQIRISYKQKEKRKKEIYNITLTGFNVTFFHQKKKKTQKQKRNNKIDSFIHITQKQKHALKKWGKEDKIT